MHFSRRTPYPMVRKGCGAAGKYPCHWLILRRMRQRTLVLEDVAQIAAIDPAVAAGHRMKCSASFAG